MTALCLTAGVSRGDDAPASDSLAWTELRSSAQPDFFFSPPDERYSNGFRARSGEPFGAEGASAEDDEPRIPEPMVFDLMRPLGARQGELEVNVLGIVPFRRRVPQATEIPDPVGVIFTDVLPRIEWAPEVEYALFDDFAVELELPMEDGIVAAYKGGAQYTFGTAFQRRFIHGVQGIIEYEVQSNVWLPTCVYIMGIRFNETWSTLNMIGVRGVINAADPGDRLERIINLNLFADLTNYATAGIEADMAVNMNGQASLLLMPQLHWEVSDYFMIQAGVGGRFTGQYSLGEAAFRVIRSF